MSERGDELKARLRHHVTGKIERGEGEPIVEIPPDPKSARTLAEELRGAMKATEELDRWDRFVALDVLHCRAASALERIEAASRALVDALDEAESEDWDGVRNIIHGPREDVWAALCALDGGS